MKIFKNKHIGSSGYETYNSRHHQSEALDSKHIESLETQCEYCSKKANLCYDGSNEAKEHNTACIYLEIRGIDGVDPL